ncbi:hypothetical protein OPT61_g5447 [Boeremia exigua]|uniref:Uncharacterized protein n=1 Tax=Boeremia exigua TaxID=749465 RepID=A0ACC2IAD1_9PLEO|nr:hypothetical protein OPT61_g5447 [Boeremia exigua]
MQLCPANILRLAALGGQSRRPAPPLFPDAKAPAKLAQPPKHAPRTPDRRPAAVARSSAGSISNDELHISETQRVPARVRASSQAVTFSDMMLGELRIICEARCTAHGLRLSVNTTTRTMDLYRATFVGSLLLNSIVLIQTYRSRQVENVDPTSSEKVEHRGREESERDSLRKLKWRFFPIYLLVNAADWLQGPYIYPIYKDEKGLTEEMVAFLFLIGFVSAGISASFAGTFADRYGRRTACLAYCILYSFSSFTLLADDIRVLFLGRVLGGICGTLLWSVFESWLVAEFNQLMIEDTSAVLSGIFSAMTILNSLVAICAGILAEWLVRSVGTAKAPFMASVGCLSVAFVAISKLWGENYGASHRVASENAALLQQEEAESAVITTKSTLRYILRVVLALVSCFFEGSLFLFIFFKFPALKLAHKLAGSEDDLPFGLIFAILMCSMMLGSLLYNNITSASSTFPAKRVLMGTLVVASACFFVPGHFRDERLTLWCFCVFELCCGVYYPVMASIKGKLIDDSSRASVYTVLRIPLNAFVVLALSTTKEGESHRDAVFTTCSGLLLVAALVVHKILA